MSNIVSDHIELTEGPPSVTFEGTYLSSDSELVDDTGGGGKGKEKDIGDKKAMELEVNY
jgi:hypothetical protein